MIATGSPNSLTQVVEASKVFIGGGQNMATQIDSQNSNRLASSRAANQDIIHVRSQFSYKNSQR